MTDSWLTQTMRWFGPRDPVSLADIRQAGCSGVVTALHEIPNGQVWPIDAIRERRALIAAAGMDWTVVESLPVHEGIKTGSADCARLIDAYRASLRNLAACGIAVVTYNFMPVLDWTRTDLSYPMPTGARALRFSMAAAAAYDLHILARPGAARDYDAGMLAAARDHHATLSAADAAVLEDTIIAGLPGAEQSFGRSDLLAAIAAYDGIDAAALRDNLIRFLEAVCPLADELGITLAIHPDDPPVPLFGLPRIVSTQDDLDAIVARVPNRSNGLCFCTGSLGVRPDNDIVAMVRRFGSRIAFLHLRNTIGSAHDAFHESDHLSGNVDMAAVMAAVVEISDRESRSIPMRPDHGHQMLDDLTKSTNPGYSAIGRLRGLAELRGLEMGIRFSAH
ncbi:MAG: mannonate dehydratase [Pseudomonadota bacterium]